MSVVVQSSYRPQIRAAVVGMIADETGYEITSRNCETAAGIGFGLAVSQGSADKGCVIAGSAFIGISVRDVTLALAPIDPLSDTAGTVDTYAQRTSMGILTRGRIWVKAMGDVAAGDPLYYDTSAGTFGQSASGQAASGSLTFSKQPVADETILINGVTLTFKASGATTNQVNIGNTLGDTLNNIVSRCLAQTGDSGGLGDIVVRADPPSPGGAGQGSGANTLLIAAKTVGTAGNSIAITTGTAVGVTRSAATLLGGTASATAVTGAKWVTSAIAGQLAIVSLGIQL